MDSIWLKIYVGIGVVVLLGFFVDLVRRRRESMLAVSGNEWMMILAVVVWPVFLPILWWSLRHGSSGKTRFIRDDEEM